MKRSEALDIIDGILIDHELPILSGISKEILSSLEQAGILPPVRDRIIEGHLCEENSWEPEDITLNLSEEKIDKIIEKVKKEDPWVLE